MNRIMDGVEEEAPNWARASEIERSEYCPRTRARIGSRCFFGEGCLQESDQAENRDVANKKYLIFVSFCI